MSNFEEEQRQINRLEFSLDYLNNMETWNRFYADLYTGEKPETKNPLLKDALNRAWAFDGGKQAAEMARRQLASHLSLMQVVYEYKNKKNPLFAFQGLKACLDAGLTPPEWIATYVRESITRLTGYAYRDTAGRPDDPLATAFNFRKGGGRRGGTWFSDYNITLDTLADVLAVMRKQAETGKGWKKAYDAIMQEKGFKSKAPIGHGTLEKWKNAILDAL